MILAIIMGTLHAYRGPRDDDTGSMVIQAFEASLERNYSTTHDKKCQRFLSAAAALWLATGTGAAQSRFRRTYHY